MLKNSPTTESEGIGKIFYNFLGISLDFLLPAYIKNFLLYLEP